MSFSICSRHAALRLLMMMANSTRRFSWTAWVLTLLIPLLSLGCMSVAAGGSAPGYSGHGSYPQADYASYEDYGGGGETEVVYGVTATATMDYAAPAPEAKTRARAVRREFAREYEEASAAPPPPAEPAPDTVADDQIRVDVPESEPQVEPVDRAASKRQIIYTATMQVSVHDVEHAVAEAEALPERLGGWLHQRTDNQLVLRIPAEKLEQAMSTIAELGVVDYRLLEALDVTAQYTDLESRIRVLEQMQAQLAELLTQAKTVEQALEVRKALDQITLELELARAQMRELSKSIAFSTLVLRFVERGPTVSVPTRNDPFTWVDALGVELTEYR